MPGRPSVCDAPAEAAGAAQAAGWDVWPRRLLAVLLTVHAGLLGWGAWRHSPTFDEAAHLPAGIRHWTHGDFELFRVNPPLPRMLAALPVLLLRPNVDWALLDLPERPGRRLEFDVARRFVDANGSRSFMLYTVGRWACIPWSLLGAWTCFQWARALYGPRAGLLAAGLWCFSPNILGHAQLITPDVPAAAAGVLACYCFWKWLAAPDWPGALTAGIALGVVELTKSTWIVLFLLWPGLYLLHRVTTRTDTGTRRPTWRGLAAILLVGLYVLNAGYGFSGTGTRLKDYAFVSRALAGPPGSDYWGNRFRDRWWGELPVPLPDQYVLGIDQQKSHFEAGTMSYLRGELRRGGWWYYYLYSLGVKVPVGVWLLTVLAMALRIQQVPRRWSFDDLMLLVPFATLLCLISAQTGINKHLRYLLPAFPFAFIWISQVATIGHWLAQRIVAFGLTGAVASSLWIYPHSMSYFNELVGGPRQGHQHLINSNIDWGQDLFFLREWLAERGIQHIYLVFWSQYDPRHAGIDFELPPMRGRPEFAPIAAEGVRAGLKPGVYAISVNHLRGYPFGAPDGRGGRAFVSEHSFDYFLQLEPIATAGYSLYLYVIPDQGTPADSQP